MTLPLPDLDDRTYDALVKEAIARIPAECPEWTDHNPSDTGIILIELLAWLTEMTLYQVNQIPDRHFVSFLSLLKGRNLLKGEHWTLSNDLSADDRRDRLSAEIRSTLKQLEHRYRAITPEDFKGLILTDWPRWAKGMKSQSEGNSLGRELELLREDEPELEMSFDEFKKAVEDELPTALKSTLTSEVWATALERSAVDRIHCLPQRDLDGEATQPTPAPGHFSVVVVPKEDSWSEVSKACLKVFLDQRRLLTTHIHVVPYQPKSVKIGATLVLTDGADPKEVRRQAIAVLQQYFHPRPEPQNPYWDGKGWPFGRRVYISELYQLLDDLRGVDYVPLLGFKDENDKFLADEKKQLIPEMLLKDNELVALEIQESDIGTEVRIGTTRYRV